MISAAPDIPALSPPQQIRRVLVGEDDPIYRRVLQSLLQRAAFEVTVVSNGAEVLHAACLADAPRLLLLDWVMPGLQGPEICRRLRQAPPSELYQYIILLSAKDAKSDAVEGLEAGADDYLTKPFDAQELLARLRAGMRILDLQDRLVEASRALQHQATHDPLTGLWNRLAWPKLLCAELERTRRSGSTLTVLMIDLDHFKSINDQLGHLAGDRVLRDVASTLCNAVRTYDISGRYGGEEFIVVATDLDEDAAYSYANRIRNEISRICIPERKRPGSLTASIGVAQVQGTDTCDADALIRAADAALYVAKELGRDRVLQVRVPTHSFAAPAPRCELATVA